MTRRSLAFYIRLSKQDRDARDGAKDESGSITGQRALLQAYVRAHGEFDGWDIREYFEI